MAEHANLFDALVTFQMELPKVAKTKTANVPTKSGGSYQYTYADLVDVTEAAIPLLTKHGLAFITTPRQTERGYELVGILAHTSGERIEGALPIPGNTAQEIGSSITYARRYLLGAMTGIVTDDDDDGSIATEAHHRREREQREATQARRELHDWTQKSGLNPTEIGRRFESDYGYPIRQADAEQVRDFQHLLAREAAEQALGHEQDQDDTPEEHHN